MLHENAMAIATQVLYREGFCLDRRDWNEWLGLYADDAVYWVPAWRNEYEETDDPNREISLIYHDSRLGLEERVMRLQSRKSITATPLPRTTHFFTNIVSSIKNKKIINAQANWMVQVYDTRTAQVDVHFGWCEIELKNLDDRWLISKKIIHLQNDRIPALIDFYTL